MPFGRRPGEACTTQTTTHSIEAWSQLNKQCGWLVASLEAPRLWGGRCTKVLWHCMAEEKMWSFCPACAAGTLPVLSLLENPLSKALQDIEPACEAVASRLTPSSKRKVHGCGWRILWKSCPRWCEGHKRCEENRRMCVALCFTMFRMGQGRYPSCQQMPRGCCSKIQCEFFIVLGADLMEAVGFKVHRRWASARLSVCQVRVLSASQGPHRETLLSVFSLF